MKGYFHIVPVFYSRMINSNDSAVELDQPPNLLKVERPVIKVLGL